MKCLIHKIDPGTGLIAVEMHRLNGRLHRDSSEGPAFIARTETGEVGEERYYWKGRLHREGGPAKLEYSVDGRAGVEMYYRHGLLHRDPQQGPAWIERYLHIIVAESYFVSGEPYRDPADGPWHISRFNSGKIEHVLFSESKEGTIGRPTRGGRASLPGRPPSP
jgi:hypothetical protein